MGLITAQEVKSNTSMGGNVDSDLFNHIINDVQVMILENVLGTKLYDKIVTDFNEGGTNNLAGDYLTMFNDYIKPVLWHSVFAEYLRDGLVRSHNGSIVTLQPEGSTTADIESIKYTSKNAQSKADVYIDRLERFLCEKDIAEYTDNQDNEYDIDPKRDFNTVGGWYLGGSGYRKTGISNGRGTDYLEIE